MNNEFAIFYGTFEPKVSRRSVEENYVLFKNMVVDLMQTFVPTIRTRTHSSNPSYNKTLKSLCNKRKRIFAKAKQTNSPCAWDSYYAALRNFTKIFRSSKSKFLRLTNNVAQKFYKIFEAYVYQNQSKEHTFDRSQRWTSQREWLPWSVKWILFSSTYERIPHVIFQNYLKMLWSNATNYC